MLADVHACSSDLLHLVHLASFFFSCSSRSWNEQLVICLSSSRARSAWTSCTTRDPHADARSLGASLPTENRGGAGTTQMVHWQDCHGVMSAVTSFHPVSQQVETMMTSRRLMTRPSRQVWNRVLLDRRSLADASRLLARHVGIRSRLSAFPAPSNCWCCLKRPFNHPIKG